MNRRNLLIAGGVILVILVIWLVFPKGQKNVSMVETVEAETQAKTQIAGDAKNLYQQAVTLKDGGDLIQAKEVYRSIVTDYSDTENIAVVQKELEDLNLKILFSNAETSKTVIHEVVSGDTLGELAKKYNTTIDLIKRSNNLSSNVIRVGQRLRVWTGKFFIHVDKSQNQLILKDDDEVLKVYDVSTGSNNSTPVGTYTITSKLIDPVWFNKGIVLPPESPHNVLGSRWLGFDLPGYGIHGTVEPEAIGQQITAGCVRMRNEEVEELYSIVPMGTEVTIVN